MRRMRYRRLTGPLSFTVVLLCVLSINAQSGRRQNKPAPAAPVPTPTPEPTPVPKKEQKEQDLMFVVGADRQGSYSIPSTYYDAIVRGCAQRLRERSSRDVDVSDRDLGRGDAIKRAKADSKTYVILLGLKYDAMARSSEDLVVEFVVFAPTTAKVVTTGHSYPAANRAGPLIVGPRGRTPGGLYFEEVLKRAGEDAADRILKAMDLGIPVPPH